MLSNISHVIYDLDGLLLDTEVIYAKAAAKVCALYGCEYDVSLKPKLIGRPAKESASDFVKWTNLPISPETFLAQRQTFLQDLLSQGNLMPGVIEVTQHFLALNISQAIATNSTRKLFNLKTKNNREWFDRIFVTAVKSDDPGVENCKPAPDLYLTAAKRLKANPKNCLVFEDSLPGVQAALSAGMFVIAVPDVSIDKNLFKNAHLVLNSLSEFNFAWISCSLANQAILYRQTIDRNLQ